MLRPSTLALAIILSAVAAFPRNASTAMELSPVVAADAAAAAAAQAAADPSQQVDPAQLQPAQLLQPALLMEPDPRLAEPVVPQAPAGVQRLDNGQQCSLDSQCASRICRCPNNFRRREQFCKDVGKVCMDLLPVGADCEDHRSCVSHKCYCAKDPWKRDDCGAGGRRKCCYWSWGYWECDGPVTVEDAGHMKNVHGVEI